VGEARRALTALPISSSVTICQLMGAERLMKLARLITTMTFLLKTSAAGCMGGLDRTVIDTAQSGPFAL